MRDSRGVLQVSGGIVDDQVVSIDALDDGAIAKRAEVALLEGCATKAQHKQHAVSVGVVFGSHRRQEVVHIPFERVGELILFEGAVVVVIADLDRPIGGQQLGAGIGLKAEHSFEQERVADLGHALHRSAIRRSLQTGDLDLQAKELDSLRPILDPLLPALEVILNAAKEISTDAAKLKVVDVINKVIEPTFAALVAPFRDRSAVERDCD